MKNLEYVPLEMRLVAAVHDYQEKGKLNPGLLVFDGYTVPSHRSDQPNIYSIKLPSKHFFSKDCAHIEQTRYLQQGKLNIQIFPRLHVALTFSFALVPPVTSYGGRWRGARALKHNEPFPNNDLYTESRGSFFVYDQKKMIANVSTNGIMGITIPIDHDGLSFATLGDLTLSRFCEFLGLEPVVEEPIVQEGSST